jgi:DNA-binding transcriptional LysR family regulator
MASLAYPLREDVAMELRQLQYFAAVARHRHFTRAAEELYVTQSALSQQVRRLESELGLALLARTSRGVELTPAGADLLRHAEAVLAEVERARAEMDRHAGVARGAVRVAAATGDSARLPEALAAFHRAHPGIQLALRQGSAAEVAAQMARGAADVGVLALAGEPPAGTRATPLPPEPLRVLCAPDDPLAGAAGVALADLRGRPFILAEPGTALRASVMAACQAAGFSPVPLLEVGDPGTVRVLAGGGLGISLVPASWVSLPGPPAGVADLADGPRHAVSLLTPAAGGSAAGRLLHEHLRLELLHQPALGAGAE